MVSYARRILHWGPLLALSVIAIISVCGLICVVQWWPISTLGGALNLALYLFWDVTTLYNFFNAIFIGPGHVPFGWKPVSDLLSFLGLHGYPVWYAAPSSTFFC